VRALHLRFGAGGGHIPIQSWRGGVQGRNGVAGRDTITGVMICGAGHSGSTLLGMVLSGLAGAVYIGEGAKVRYLGDASKPLRKRACKICGDACAFWSGFCWDETLGEGLYAAVARHAGAAIVIDSSKKPLWIAARAEELRAAGHAVRLVFLTRDGRAVVNSRLRKYPDRDAAEQIADWLSQIEAAQALADAFPGPVLRLAYEDLATAPSATAARLAAFVGAPFDSSMLAFSQREHHPLGGNNGTQFLAARAQKGAIVRPGARSAAYYQAHPDAIRLDLRWREEFRPEHAALFERIAGPVNETMKWGP